jgi:hypothetical protein
VVWVQYGGIEPLCAGELGIISSHFGTLGANHDITFFFVCCLALWSQDSSLGGCVRKTITSFYEMKSKVVL